MYIIAGLGNPGLQYMGTRHNAGFSVIDELADKHNISIDTAKHKGMIGKGARSKEVIDAMVRNKCVYFAAIGGAAALIAKSIKSEELLCYEDLGTEAVRRYTVEDFPCIVAIDSEGNNVYETEPVKYRVF